MEIWGHHFDFQAMYFYFTHSFLNQSTFHLDGPLFATPITNIILLIHKTWEWKYKGSPDCMNFALQGNCAMAKSYHVGISSKYVKLILRKAVFCKKRAKYRTLLGIVLSNWKHTKQGLPVWVSVNRVFKIYFFNKLSSLLFKSKYVRNILNYIIYVVLYPFMKHCGIYCPFAGFINIFISVKQKKRTHTDLPNLLSAWFLCSLWIWIQ